MGHVKQDAMPVIRELADFDRRSGNLLERLVFNHRALFMLFMTLATLVLGYMATTRLELRPSFEKMIPQSQPYIKNFLENRQSLRGLGNSVRVVVENPRAVQSAAMAATKQNAGRREMTGLQLSPGLIVS